MTRWLFVLAALAGLLRRDSRVEWEPPGDPIPQTWRPLPMVEPDAGVCGKSGCKNPAVGDWCSESCHRLWQETWNRRDVA